MNKKMYLIHILLKMKKMNMDINYDDYEDKDSK